MLALDDDLTCIAVGRAEPQTRGIGSMPWKPICAMQPEGGGDHFLVGEGGRLLSHHQPGE